MSSEECIPKFEGIVQEQEAKGSVQKPQNGLLDQHSLKHMNQFEVNPPSIGPYLLKHELSFDPNTLQ